MKGGTLKERRMPARRIDRNSHDYAIYEHCLPLTSAAPSSRGPRYLDPRSLETTNADLEMWRSCRAKAQLWEHNSGRRPYDIAFKLNPYEKGPQSRSGTVDGTPVVIVRVGLLMPTT